jgi:DUF4097 and DUF4098 domain-containing protein YvlB
METKHKLNWIGLIILFLLTLSLSGAATAQEKVDLSNPAAADGAVHIKNVSGSVTVVGWSKNEIHVEGTLGKGTEKLDFDVDGNRAVIEVKLPKDARDVEGSHLVVSLPSGSRVKVSTVSADIEASEVTNRLTLNSVSGDITAEGKLNEVDAETVSGDIELTVDSGEVSAQSVSGDIELANVKGDVHVNTVSGDVDIQGGVFQRLKSGSVSGSVEFQGSFQSGGSYSFSSHSGDLVLSLPADVDAEFEVSTFSGDIENDFGAKGKRTSKYTPGKELHFTTGNGDATVEIETFSGDVELIKE